MGKSEQQRHEGRGGVDRGGSGTTTRPGRWRRVLAACGLSLLLTSAPAAAQICGGTYLMQGNPTALIELDTSANPFVPVTLGTAGFLYNAMAFRPFDSTLYAIQGGTNILIQVNIDGSVTTIGPVVGLPVPGGSNYHVAAFADDDRMYVRRGNNNTTLFAIDVDALSATAVPLTGALVVSDLAWFDGRFWGVNGANNLVSVTTGGNVTVIGPTGAPSSQFGAMISASNGIFGVNNNGHGFFQFDPDTGEATLISDAPGSGNNDGARCLTAALQFDADLSVTKDDGSTTYLPGTDVVYTVVVANAGPFGVQNAVVSDPLPAGITTAAWTCTADAGAVCDASAGTGAISGTPDLPVGSSVTYQVTFSVPIDFTGDLENVATVTPPAGFNDPNPSNNTATDVNTSAAQPGLALDKTGDGPEPLAAGAQIQYSFLVTNIGNVPLTDVTVTDPLPGLSPISCPATTLAPAASLTCTAVYTITQQDADSGILQNTATVTAQPPGGLPPTTAQDSLVLPPSQAPGISLVKTASGSAPLTLGSVVNYAFLVTNTGNLTLTNVTVSDPLVGLSPVSCPTTTLAPAEAMTCTATYTVTQADVVAGVVQNAATVTGTPPSGLAPPTATSLSSFPAVMPVPAMPTVVLLLLVTALTVGSLLLLRRRTGAQSSRRA